MIQTNIGITVDAFREMLESRQPVTVLDVRPVEERAEWAIPGSIHVDAYTALREGDPDALAGLDLPDGPVVTVCAAGRTSLIAALQLRGRGIEALSLSGGMKGWSLAWNSVDIRLASGSTEVVQVRRTGKGCLSYLIASNRCAAVVDAALPPEVYQRIADERGWTITHVFDTHIHADHLTRARQLAAATGATLLAPDQERVAYPFSPIRDGDVVRIGDTAVTALHTPGHTPESMSYLLDDKVVLTGDTLFLEGVGRPDLEASAGEATTRAHALYGSLQKLCALPPDTIVLPGHTSSPVPFDREPVLRMLADVVERIELLQHGEDSFVTSILGRIPPTPPNHALIVQLNEAGLVPELVDTIDLEAGANRCAVS